MKNWIFVSWFSILILSAISTGRALAASPDEPDPTMGTDRLEYFIVVTANRTETPQAEVGSDITVISNDQLVAMQKETVLDVLRTVPALDVVQTGGAGGQTSVFIRGAKPEHAKILWDGVALNDPSTPGRSADFATFSTDGIERIEIIRGPQSVLYGSDAMSGVINIISKTDAGRLAGNIIANGGSFGTFHEAANLSGGTRWASYSLSLARLDSKGISAASERDGNTERDRYGNTTLAGKLVLKPAKNVYTDLIVRHIDSKADLDNAGGVGGDDPNNTAKSDQTLFRAQTRLSLLDGRWEHTFGLALNHQKRSYRNDTDADHPVDLDRSTYQGQTLRFDWQSNFRFQDTHTLTAGAETEQERGKSDYYSESAWGPYSSAFDRRTARTSGVYLQDHVLLGRSLFTTIGVRLDDHSQFGTHATFRLTASYLIKTTSTRFKGSYGTGFRAPSLYQLYSSYGTESLQPETNKGWDVGCEQSFAAGRFVLGSTVFRNHFKQMIDYDAATWKYLNVGAALTRGIEVTADWKPVDDLTLQANYTYTRAIDETSGERLLRRPKHKVGVVAAYRFDGCGDLSLDVHYVGRRDDMDYSTWSAARVSLGSYVLANLAASYELVRHVRVCASVRNLGDVKYEEVLGYGTPGISFLAGVNYLF